MFLLTLLSATLFVIPVFVTFGAYFAAEYEKILSCGLHCGSPGGGLSSGTPGFGGGGGAAPGSDELVGQLYCQLSYGITPDPGNYVYNPNQWGNKDGDQGSMCLNFTSEGDSPSGYGAGWAVTWDYPAQSTTGQPVRAFPHAQLDDDNLPLQISELSSLPVDIQWAYKTGPLTLQLGTDQAQLTAAEVNANVCIDMFLSADESKADSTTDSDFEVMVWFAAIGPDVVPLGGDNAALDTKIVDGVTYSLYSEANNFGQLTFTWLASTYTTEFKGDIAPFLEDLAQFKGPQPDDYLGYIAFGSETFWAASNATFWNPKLDLVVNKA